MRASATSRISSPASLHAAHARQDASKADASEASPFAALVQSSQAKDKAAVKDQHKPEDDKADIKKSDAAKNKQTAKADNKSSQQAAKTDKTDKSDKSDKSDEADDKPAAKADDAAADATAVAAEAPKPETPPPAPQTILGAAQPAADPSLEDGSDEASATAPVGAAAPQAAQPAAQPADKALEQAAAAQQANKPDAKADTKTDAAKPAKPGSFKIADIKGAKADDKTDAPAAADAAPARTAEPQFAAADASTPKNTPVNPDNVGALTAPQAKAPDAPVLAQHVQVTTPQAHQPTPNIPALAVQIATKSAGGTKQFDIRLDPPELGHVQVRLSIDATGKATAHLSADQPQTLELLQKDASSLTRALREAGVEVAQDGLNFSLRQQAQENGAQNGQSGQDGRRGRTNALTATASLAASPQSAPVWRGMADGRLDIRV